jgi:hypothetical protein
MHGADESMNLGKRTKRTTKKVNYPEASDEIESELGASCTFDSPFKKRQRGKVPAVDETPKES